MCPTNLLASFGQAAFLADESAGANALRAHFLVVDDISSMRRVICALLKDQLRNIRISEAPDGASAIQVIKAAEKAGTPIDFVVSDWNMPHMDGITLLRTIRQEESTRHLPVLMVTAETTREMILEAAHAGADGYIVKPFNASTLREKLDQIFAKRKRGARTMAVAA